jgi:hypothetical protein
MISTQILREYAQDDNFVSAMRAGAVYSVAPWPFFAAFFSAFFSPRAARS